MDAVGRTRRRGGAGSADGLSREHVFAEVRGFGFAGNEVRYTYLLVSLVIVLVAGMPGVGLAILLYILYSLVIWLVGRCK